MYIYNVTIQLDKIIEKNWLQWMYQEHLQEVMDTGCFDSYTLLELLEPIEPETKTFIVQYFTDSNERYANYIENYAPLLRQKGLDKFQNQFIAFRSILKKL